MRAISLFSGAGGLDLGFQKAGFKIIVANDFDKDACETYRNNIREHIIKGKIEDVKHQILQNASDVDVVFGGPPCQGFSVAGKMDPDDPRSQHIWNFAEFVEQCRPKSFVLENVKSLGFLKKWERLRDKLLHRLRKAGYMVNFVVLNASDFDVPQSRERVFFIGFKGNSSFIPDLSAIMEPYKKRSPTVREALSVLDRAGTGNNRDLAKAKITVTPKPIMRKSAYAGMLFNGLGRPVKIDGYCATLPATMGGNKTPIIDEEALYDNAKNWVEEYHASLCQGKAPLPFQEAPKRLRRLTVQEASILQTFPKQFIFSGSQSSIFKQIGNAVPCNLGYAVGSMLHDHLKHQAEEHSFETSAYLRLVS